MDPQIDKLERRCPRLGGPVCFEYCMRGETSGQPCFKILDCWWERFDVQHYLKAILPPEQFEKTVAGRSAAAQSHQPVGIDRGCQTKGWRGQDTGNRK